MTKILTLKDGNLINLIKSLPAQTVIPLKCSGTSMEPTFLNNKTVVYLFTGSDINFSKGDVILFYRNNGKAVLHRIKSIILSDNKIQYVLNGDSQTWTERIDHSQILAKVIGFQYKGSNDKYIDVNNKLYKLYVYFWNSIFFLRSYIIRIIRHFKLI